MMNDEKTTLQSLEQRLQQLENENKSLRSRLELADLKNDDIYKPVSLTDYYLSKYLELHDHILTNRVSKINSEKGKYQEEYNKIITNELDESKSSEEISLEIEQLKLEYDEKIANSEKELDNTNKTLKNLIRDIEASLAISEQYTNEYYDNLVQHIGHASFSDTIEYMDFIITVAKNSLYDQNVEIYEQIQVATKTNQAIEDIEYRLQMEKTTYSDELKQLNEKLYNFQKENTEEYLTEIKGKLASLEENQIELVDLFKDTKAKHIKEICDTINHMQIMDTPNKEIATKMDELLEVDFTLLLQTIDTESNSNWKKQDELASLKLKFAQLEKAQQEYSLVVSEYDNLQSMYESINSNITQIEEYVTFSMKAIEAHAAYLKFYDMYMALYTKEAALVKDIDTLNDEIISFKETKRSKALDPYARPIINELNENIALRESKIDRSKVLLEKTRQELEEIAKTKEDTVLLNVIKEKLNCEKHLPELYNKQRALMLIVEDKYTLVQELKKELTEYESIEEKIGELSNEINH